MIAATVYMMVGSGCASRAGETNEADSAGASISARTRRATLTELVGRWSGDNRLWVLPGDPVRESPASARVESVGRGALACITYTWSYEGTPQEGTLMIRTDSDPDDAAVVWIDSWHTSNKFMLFHGEEGKPGLVAVRGSYAAPPGPDWGWRITIGADSADEFHVVMHNITPEGQEALAVETRYRRVAPTVR